MVEKEVYRIINKDTGGVCGSYSRACHTEVEFKSVEEARNSNVHGLYQKKEQYRIAKYKVTYELVDMDCDNANSVQPREDGYPQDWDTWTESRQAHWIANRNLAKEISNDIDKFCIGKESGKRFLKNISKGMKGEKDRSTF